MLDFFEVEKNLQAELLIGIAVRRSARVKIGIKDACLPFYFTRSLALLKDFSAKLPVLPHFGRP